jgi:hypothetical protein
MKSCYLVNLPNQDRLYVTPFVDPSTSATWDEHDQLSFFSASSPAKGQKDEALFTLYTQIDRGVDRWIQDVRYLPRLLIGGLIFLVSYFFFSLAVRDPVPMVDELVIATIITVFSLIVIARRDKNSSMSVKRRFELKQNASEVTFEIEEQLEEIEQYLYRYSQLEMIDLIDSIVELEGSSLENLPLDIKKEHMVNFPQLFLETMEFSYKNIYSLSQKYQKIKTSDKLKESFSAQLLKLGMNKEVNLSLLALTIAIENQYLDM